MFFGKFSTGDELLDKIAYAIIAVIIVVALDTFGAPFANKILSTIWWVVNKLSDYISDLFHL